MSHCLCWALASLEEFCVETINKVSLFCVEEVSLPTPPSTSMSASTPTPREVITHYHTLQKQLASLPYNTAFPNAAARQAQASLLKAQLAQISLPKYQEASLEGESQKVFDVTTWVLSNLPSGDRILDVGSIVHRFPDVFNGRQLNVTSIDLHSKDERVTKIDFFEYGCDDLFDAVVLSLCVNFVGCPQKRGVMIRKAASLLKHGASLFLVLPGACVKNSRYFNEKVLKEVLNVCGFEVVNVSYERKLCMVISTRQRYAERSTSSKCVKRRLVRNGRERNNFAIIVDVDQRTDGSTESAKLVGGKNKEKKNRRASRNGKDSTPRTKQSGRNAGIAKTTSNQRRRARRQRKCGEQLNVDVG